MSTRSGRLADRELLSAVSAISGAADLRALGELLADRIAVLGFRDFALMRPGKGQVLPQDHSVATAVFSRLANNLVDGDDRGQIAPGTVARAADDLDVGEVFFTRVVSSDDVGLVLLATASTPPAPDVLTPLRLLGTAVSLRLIVLAAREENVLGLFTAVQQQILHWMEQGKSNGDIAAIIGISKRNCDYHVSEIFRKLGVSSRTQAVTSWRRT